MLLLLFGFEPVRLHDQLGRGGDLEPRRRGPGLRAGRDLLRQGADHARLDRVLPAPDRDLRRPGIGKPDSPWGRRFYGERRPEKQAKAVERFRPDRRTERFKQRFRDVVGGATEEEYEAKLARDAAQRTEAAEKVRERAERVS